MSSQVRASRSVHKEGGKVSVELDIGEAKGTSYFVSAVYVPGDQGYISVSTEPVEKKVACQFS